MKVFIIYTADDCGACLTFKRNHLGKLLELIDKYDSIKVRHINIKSMKDDQPTEDIHPQLKMNKKWFPSFYLFDETQFNNHNSNLSGHVLGGSFINGRLIYDKEAYYSYEANNIFKWLQSLIVRKPTHIIESSEYSMLDWYKLF